MSKKKQTVVNIYGLFKRKKTHYKSVTLDASPEKIWKALTNGCSDVLDVDLATLRAERKRKGGAKRKR